MKSKKLHLTRISHKYDLLEKTYSAPIDFKLGEVDYDKYASHVYEKASLTDDRTIKKEVVDIKDSVVYTRYMLAAEVARYLNISPVFADRILSECVDGADVVTETVSKYNEVRPT